MDIASSAGKIQVLPGDVIGRIAAGEVVERPAAVVKELLENSLDAGSSTITVEIKDGGLGLIRVSDDGEGMSRRDASLAFERHATSKLQSDAQLGAIRTMGFRGRRCRASQPSPMSACERWPGTSRLERNSGLPGARSRGWRMLPQFPVRRSRCRICSSIRRLGGNF
ncbi:MAG: ATP-binding protein [Nitrospira sp.]|nr:ATP-binding protein [Nitrospira sp.]